MITSQMWILVIAVIVTLGVGVLWLQMYLKRKQKKFASMSLPAEVLADFETAERRLKESNGERDPHTILWEIAKERREQSRINSRPNNTVVTAEPTNGTTDILAEPTRPEDVQSTGPTMLDINQPIVREVEQHDNRNKGFFQRLFSRK